MLGFQKARHLDALTEASAHVPLIMVEEVYDEVTDPRNGKHADAASRAKFAIDGSKINRRSIALGSIHATTFASLRTGKSSATADLGEAASIALAAHDASLTFVSNDAAATLRGLQELRGRTLSFHPFVAVLVERGALTMAKAGTLATAIRALGDWKATHPLWWDNWLAAAGPNPK